MIIKNVSKKMSNLQVAQHLCNTYGDRAFVVARMCRMTGKRWPIVGHRLHPEFPYLDAEVKFVYFFRRILYSLKEVQSFILSSGFLNTNLI